MERPTQTQNLDPQAQARPAETDENRPKTWSDKHIGVVLIVGTLVLVILLLVFNMN